MREKTGGAKNHQNILDSALTWSIYTTENRLEPTDQGISA